NLGESSPTGRKILWIIFVYRSPRRLVKVTLVMSSQRSRHHCPAVDPEHLAGHETSSVAEQVPHGPGDILWHSEGPKRRHRLQGSEARGAARLVDAAVGARVVPRGHRGDDDARGDSVDADTARAKLDRQRLG